MVKITEQKAENQLAPPELESFTPEVAGFWEIPCLSRIPQTVLLAADSHKPGTFRVQKLRANLHEMRTDVLM